jgi:hypothetical protein
MLRTFFTIILILASTRMYAYSAYNLKKEDLTVSKESFKRYVRPQIRNIIQEYYHILKKLNPAHTPLIEIKKIALDLVFDWYDWRKECNQVSENCNLKLSSFYLKVTTLEKKILKVSNKPLFDLKQKSHADIDSNLSLLYNLNTMYHFTYKILHYLEELLIISNVDFYTYSSPKEKFNQLLRGLLTQSEMSITSQLDKKYQGEFEALRISYIKPLEENVLLQNDSKYLENHFGKLNLSWNSFHMHVAKGSKIIPTSAQKIVTIMHRRWNSILKILLK